jgi:hypothetical protein
LALDVVGSEDGHAQERSLLEPLLNTVVERDVWVADRNFCTTAFLFGVAGRGGSFVIRRHASTLTWERESAWVEAGRTETGAVAEQTIWLRGPGGAELAVRRVRLTLDAPTRDGDGTIEILTNLPAAAAAAATVCEVYRARWTVEGLFQRLTVVLKCEVNTLGYPPAAVFGFCVALAASNVYAGVRGALRAAHGAGAADAVSDYHLAVEVSGAIMGLGIAVPAEAWSAVPQWSVDRMSAWLVGVARRAKLSRYTKGTRGPKKPKPRRTRYANARHVATARLLKGEQK